MCSDLHWLVTIAPADLKSNTMYELQSIAATSSAIVQACGVCFPDWDNCQAGTPVRGQRTGRSWCPRLGSGTDGQTTHARTVTAKRDSRFSSGSCTGTLAPHGFSTVRPLKPTMTWTRQTDGKERHWLR
eukprot:SAG22_NODE_2582_length_2417_cov_2.970233_3_plen_129_part_00